MPLFRQIAPNSLRQLRFAKGFVAGDRRLPRLSGQFRNSRRPRLAFLRRVKLKPAVNAGEQTTAAVLRRIETAGQIIHQPVFIRLAGGLPLQDPLAGQAAAELNHDLRLRQLAHRFAVAQPQVSARQRLPGL